MPTKPSARQAASFLTLLALLLGLLSAGLSSQSAQARTYTAQTNSTPVVAGPVWLRSHKVTVEIDNQIAVTKIDQVLSNSTSRDQEAVYLFPVPARSAISDFTMYVDGKRLEAQLLDQGQARGVYEQIVRTQRDPALLEYAGQGAVKVSVYPVPANGDKRIQIQYNQVLKAENGLAEWVYPLSLPQFSSRPLQDLSVNMIIRSKDGLKALYSPSHSVAITRNGPNEAQISYQEHNTMPARDFRFLYGAGEGDFSLNFLTYRDQAETTNKGNYFMMLVSPKVTDKLDTKQVIAKDVILVLDTSGSMEGDKITQARKALLSVLNGLNSQDRFNIITFESYVKTYATGLQTMDRRPDALNWIGRIQAGGGTNINDALQTALHQADEGHQSNRPQTILFLTDGQPTSGETNQGRILANTKTAAGSNVRLFCFGVGFDVNTALLDNLANQNQGVSDYVKPTEDVEEKVSTLYSRISQPVLTNLSLEFSDVAIDDFYPRPLPDLFFGSQLVLTGRLYPKNGGTNLPPRTNAILKGFVNGQSVSFEYKDLVVQSDDNSETRTYIPRLWAGRRVGNLLTQIQANPGSAGNKELIDEVTKLSVRYGIITPYTSFLVRENTPAPAQAQPGLVGGAAAGTTAAMTSAAATTAAALADPRYQATAAATVAAAAAAAPSSGSGAVSNSQQTGGLANSNVAPSVVADAGGQTAIKYAADKTFIFTGGIWTDTTYDGKSTPTRIAFGTDRYFELMQKRQQWSSYFAVGNELLVVLDGQPYRISATGESAAVGSVTPSGTTPATVTTPAAITATASATSTDPARSTVVAVNVPTPVASSTGNPVSAQPLPARGAADNSSWWWLAGLGLAVIIGAGVWLVRRRATSSKQK